MKLGGRLRTYFLAGLAVSAPIAITIWLVWWFVSLFDGLLKPLIPYRYNPDSYLPFTVPGVGLVVALVGITLIGALAANLVGRTIISYWEYFLNRMPVVRSIYKAVKQIFETAVSQSSGSFRQVALIEWPHRGMYAIAFVSRELDSGEIGLSPGRKLWAVFMPTTPNPTSGFLLFLPEEDLQLLTISVEEGAKIVISAGLVTKAQGEGNPVDAREALAMIEQAASNATPLPAGAPPRPARTDTEAS